MGQYRKTSPLCTTSARAIGKSGYQQLMAGQGASCAMSRKIAPPKLRKRRSLNLIRSPRLVCPWANQPDGFRWGLDTNKAADGCIDCGRYFKHLDRYRRSNEVCPKMCQRCFACPCIALHSTAMTKVRGRS